MNLRVSGGTNMYQGNPPVEVAHYRLAGLEVWDSRQGVLIAAQETGCLGEGTLVASKDHPGPHQVSEGRVANIARVLAEQPEGCIVFTSVSNRIEEQGQACRTRGQGPGFVDHMDPKPVSLRHDGVMADRRNQVDDRLADELGGQDVLGEVSMDGGIPVWQTQTGSVETQVVHIVKILIGTAKEYFGEGLAKHHIEVFCEMVARRVLSEYPRDLL